MGKWSYRNLNDANQVKSGPMKLRKFKWANEVENWLIMLINDKWKFRGANEVIKIQIG